MKDPFAYAFSTCVKILTYMDKKRSFVVVGHKKRNFKDKRSQ